MMGIGKWICLAQKTKFARIMISDIGETNTGEAGKMIRNNCQESAYSSYHKE